MDVVKEALRVKDSTEGAETDEFEEVDIAMIDDLYETESETSNEEAENFKSACCQKMFTEKTGMMKHVEVFVLGEDNESEEEGITQENFSCHYCQEFFSKKEDVMMHIVEH